MRTYSRNLEDERPEEDVRRPSKSLRIDPPGQIRLDHQVRQASVELPYCPKTTERI